MHTMNIPIPIEVSYAKERLGTLPTEETRFTHEGISVVSSPGQKSMTSRCDPGTFQTFRKHIHSQLTTTPSFLDEEGQSREQTSVPECSLGNETIHERLGKFEGGGIGHACQSGVEVVLATEEGCRKDR